MNDSQKLGGTRYWAALGADGAFGMLRGQRLELALRSLGRPPVEGLGDSFP